MKERFETTEGGSDGKSDIGLQGGVIGGIDEAGIPNRGQEKIGSQLGDSTGFGAKSIERGRRPFPKVGEAKVPMQPRFKGRGCWAAWTIASLWPKA